MTKAICVFCGASKGTLPSYVELAYATGKAIADRGYSLVYGGGGLGLMGATARGTAEAGGDVLGIIPRFLSELEQVVTDEPHIFVETMHERKTMMYEKADAFIVLPGGIGTMEEAVEVMSWARLKLHCKPIVFLSHDDFWHPMRELLDHIVDREFAPTALRQDMSFTSTIEGALALIEQEWEDRVGRKVGQGVFADADLL